MCIRGGWALILVCVWVFGCSGSEKLTPKRSSEKRALTGSALEEVWNLPEVNDHRLRILTPTVLELILYSTKAPDPARASQWDFVGDNFQARLPPASAFEVRIGGRPVPVQGVGFKRRARYAPLKKRDLRIGNHLYLQLAAPVAEGSMVEVKNADQSLWAASMKFEAAAERWRWSPVIHVNQAGYLPRESKKAMAGYYLGSLGELEVSGSGTNAVSAGVPSSAAEPEFTVVEAENHREVFRGRMHLRPDVGFTFSCYQKVWEADFSEFQRPGRYQLSVPGLGVSLPFLVDEGVAAAFTRAYALGLYHQRCGVSNALPFTRFVHGPCHTQPAEVPTKDYPATEHFLADMSSDYKADPKHTAPQLKSVEASLYPFVRKGRVDVSGGHHDAGDYSKYTIDSAHLIHTLVFAADVFPGVADLDNLGLPESGDGKSDLLQEAKWEADFLAKMQDADGGFYFLVYPRDRAYEDNVLPDAGDPQVVFPKTTAVTAAAVAALAQASSSPRFRKEFPAAAQEYFEKAKRGWDFLKRAIQEHGRDGAYQKITHYGNEFGHEDELAWAGVEMFLATGDRQCEKEVIARFDPSSRETKRWTWVRMFEAYGCAMRSYVFAEKSGRRKESELDPGFLDKCRAEVLGAGLDQARFAEESAYGTSFPDPTKRFRTAGWYFSMDQAFDIAVAMQLHGTESKAAGFKAAILGNLNYEGGCNPVNVSFITGLGWKRPRDIVHQYAQNDRRVLPPSGLPLGNVQGGFQYLDNYQKELGTVSFPPDGAEEAPYPFYDRWGDSFNTTTEFVVVNQALQLATAAWLMAGTAVKTQAWRSATAEIIGLPAEARAHQRVRLELRSPLDLENAAVVWEASRKEPALGRVWEMELGESGPAWIESEAQLPDGRRVFAVKEFEVRP